MNDYSEFFYDLFGVFDCGIGLVLLMMVVSVTWFIILFLLRFQTDRSFNASICFGGRA